MYRANMLNQIQQMGGFELAKHLRILLATSAILRLSLLNHSWNKFWTVWTTGFLKNPHIQAYWTCLHKHLLSNKENDENVHSFEFRDIACHREGNGICGLFVSNNARVKFNLNLRDQTLEFAIDVL